MHRPTGFALLCLALLLVIFPLTVVKPGLPMTLKADEPAYYLMALSLGRDFDLRCELPDLGRLFDEYPYLATSNLILMTDDGWDTVFFGKPYIYSLFAAPFAVLFGANGMVAFNMALMMAMIWMGAVYLERFNPPAIAALFSSGFFLLSCGFPYVFWLHPEIFNMFCVASSLFLTLHRFPDKAEKGRGLLLRTLFAPSLRPAWSGAILALAVYNKPMLVALALPSIVSFWTRRHWRSMIVWMSAAAGCLALVCGLSLVLTGHPSAYLGVERMGVQVFDPEQMPVQPVERPDAVEEPTTNSWTWLLRVPEIDVSELMTHSGYFLWGRHVGVVPYMPFAVVSLLLFLLWGRNSGVRWAVLGSALSVALFFLIWIPFNWHGGGGFIGNRYFVNVYPAFLFLVTVIRPAWATAVGYAAGGLFIGPLLFTPFGAPVAEPTLQAHVRNSPLRYFPLELDFRKKLPGYKGFASSGAWFFGRKDAFQVDRDDLLVQGATEVELWMFVANRIDEEVVFRVESEAPDNRVEIYLGDSEVDLDFSPEQGSPQGQRIEIRPGRPYGQVEEGSRRLFAYRLRIHSRTGHVPNAARNAARKYPVNDFYVGARLTYLGPKSWLERDLYEVDWGRCDPPKQVVAGQTFSIPVELINRSEFAWPAQGPTRITLSYHWLDAQGNRLQVDELRGDLPRDVPPARSVSVDLTVAAPLQPGRYTLTLDPVRERVSWFSQQRDGDPCRAEVEVTAALEPSRDTQAP